MKLKNLIGDRFKERPSDCAFDSQALLQRGGYLKQVANGIYSQYPPLRRILKKIEDIIREEMDGIGGQEVLLPVAMPAALWQESGRYDAIGGELLRFTDRNESQMVLGMTHEEAAVQLVREYGKSYASYPFLLYQIQTKFRDEARPRGGLIRVREFTMKDAYSFHTSQEDLENTYQQCFSAYQRIFTRTGLRGAAAVESDSGMMGGSVSHEFMLLTPVGEDTIVKCSECGYLANMEAAPRVSSLVSAVADAACPPLTLIETPQIRTIDALASFLGCSQREICKAVVYQTDSGKTIVAFLRGDLEVNEAKLKNLLGEELRPAALCGETSLVPGFIGPVDLQAQGTNFQIFYDLSLRGASSLCCGGNKEDFHYSGFSFPRDAADAVFHDIAKVREGDVCPVCKKPSITLSRGIEIGNIFQLGTKYTKAMGMQYLNEDGSPQYPLMGCYGIGVGRLAASVCEAFHDEFGPIWPASIAPWQIHLCCLRADDPETKGFADALYVTLEKRGLEVLYDDRKVSAGIQFSDADLLGIPVRIIVSPRGLKAKTCELATRDKGYSQNIPLADAADQAETLFRSLLDSLRP